MKRIKEDIYIRNVYLEHQNGFIMNMNMINIVSYIMIGWILHNFTDDVQWYNQRRHSIVSFYFEDCLAIRISKPKQRRESKSPLQKYTYQKLSKCSGKTFDVGFLTIINKYKSNMNFPGENRERELEVVKGEDDELLLPLPGSVAHLPVDQTRLNIKNINLTEFWDLLGDFPVVVERNAY